MIKKKETLLEVIARNVADMKSSMVTKEFLEEKLEPLARKDDLIDFVTRDEFDRKVAKLATKDDITKLEVKIDGLKITEITPLKERVTKLEKQAHPAHA